MPFSDQRLQSIVERWQTAPAQSLVAGITAEVRAFSAGAPQFDDVTCLAVRFPGRA